MDSDEEYDVEPLWKGVPGTIILINIFNHSKHTTSSTAHVATCRLMRQYLRTASTHYLSVCIYGTEESKVATFDIKPVDEIIPLTIPNLENYEKLKNTKLANLIEAKEFNLSDVLWHCNKMFNSCKKKLSSRTIIMLTRLDIPPSPADREQTLNRAVDLVDSNINLKIINVSENAYEIDSFYDKFLKIANRGLDYITPQPIWDVNDIEKSVFQESHRNIAVAKLNFEVGNNFSIGVSVYTLFKKSGMKCNDLERESNAVLSSYTKTLKGTIDNNDDASQEQSETKEIPLLKSEILYSQEFGGEKVEFTDSEMKMIKSPFGPPMMKLLGFKPASIICKEKLYFKAGYFLYPNETIIEGSTIALKALHKACIETKMVAICILCIRVNSRPHIVALSPCSRSLNVNIEVGFDIINIPFIENVRELNINEDGKKLNNEDDPEDENPEIDQADKQLMLSILKSTTIDYTVDMFEDPILQSKYNAMEAIALEEDEVDNFVDTTKPNPERFKDLPGDLFEELFGPFSSMTLKRGGSKMASQGSKKPKVEKEVDVDLLSSRLNDKKIESYTVPQLKDILRYKNLKDLPALNGLKKADLVSLVYKHCHT